MCCPLNMASAAAPPPLRQLHIRQLIRQVQGEVDGGQLAGALGCSQGLVVGLAQLLNLLALQVACMCAG